MTFCYKNVFILYSTLLWVVSLSAQAPDTLWTRTFTGNASDVGRSVVPSSDEDFLIAGYTHSSRPNDGTLMTDSSCVFLWIKISGGIAPDLAYSVKAASNI